MNYPKVITIESDKLKKLLTEKSDFVMTGRTMSEEIEKLEAEMQEIDNQMKEAEKTVDITEFISREKEISDRMDACIKDIEQVQKEIREKMIANTPKELGDKYDKLKNVKESLENERNRVALNVQKRNDKIIPLGRKLMKPYLEDTYDDFDSLSLEDNKIVASIFNHVETFKSNFKKK